MVRDAVWHVETDTSTVIYPTALGCGPGQRGRTTRAIPAGCCLSTHRALLGQRHGQHVRRDLCLCLWLCHSLKHQAQLPLPSHTFSLRNTLYERIQKNEQWNTHSVLARRIWMRSPYRKSVTRHVLHGSWLNSTSLGAGFQLQCGWILPPCTAALLANECNQGEF